MQDRASPHTTRRQKLSQPPTRWEPPVTPARGPISAGHGSRCDRAPGIFSVSSGPCGHLGGQRFLSPAPAPGSGSGREGTGDGEGAQEGGRRGAVTEPRPLLGRFQKTLDGVSRQMHGACTQSPHTPSASSLIDRAGMCLPPRIWVLDPSVSQAQTESSSHDSNRFWKDVQREPCMVGETSVAV